MMRSVARGRERVNVCWCSPHSKYLCTLRWRQMYGPHQRQNAIVGDVSVTAAPAAFETNSGAVLYSLSSSTLLMYETNFISRTAKKKFVWLAHFDDILMMMMIQQTDTFVCQNRGTTPVQRCGSVAAGDGGFVVNFWVFVKWAFTQSRRNTIMRRPNSAAYDNTRQLFIIYTATRFYLIHFSHKTCMLAVDAWFAHPWPTRFSSRPCGFFPLHYTIVVAIECAQCGFHTKSTQIFKFGCLSSNAT